MDLLWWEELLRLFIAGLLGAAVGFDREIKKRPAGLRTMTLVSMGAAAFVLMGIHTMAHVDKLDISRILQGIATGVGFVGAGVMIQSGGKVRGVTTAATVWVAASIGSSIAVGAYALGALITGLTIIVLWPMKRIEDEKMNKDQNDNATPGERDNDRRSDASTKND